MLYKLAKGVKNQIKKQFQHNFIVSIGGKVFEMVHFEEIMKFTNNFIKNSSSHYFVSPM